jgi:predicted nucleotidyltransferase
MQEVVPGQVAERIRAVLARHPSVTRAVLFGSRAKGNFLEGSDIDLALEGEDLGERELADIRSELDDEPIAHRVDLILKKTITHRELLEHIERVGVVFYERG